MGLKYLIDTNAAIDFLNNKLPQNGERLLAEVIDQEPLLSVVTKIEMLRFVAPKQAYQTMVNFVADCSIIALDDIVVNRTISV